MEIIFNCSQCDQEFSIDESSAGSEFDCPNCGTHLVVPAPSAGTASAAPQSTTTTGTVSSIKTSAAAREEHHFKVPMHERAQEVLIEKPKAPLEVAAKEGYKIRVKTIRHSECVEVGHDKFDDIVTTFLNKIGETSIISITTVTYQHIDIGSQKAITDYGVLIIYKSS